MGKNIWFSVEIEGVGKVERTVFNEMDAVQAIEDLKEGLSKLKELGYESAPGTPGGYHYRLYSEDGINGKGEAVAESEYDCIDAVRSLTSELFQAMVFLGLIDIAVCPLIAAGYSGWVSYRRIKWEEKQHAASN